MKAYKGKENAKKEKEEREKIERDGDIVGYLVISGCCIGVGEIWQRWCREESALDALQERRPGFMDCPLGWCELLWVCTGCSQIEPVVYW